MHCSHSGGILQGHPIELYDDIRSCMRVSKKTRPGPHMLATIKVSKQVPHAGVSPRVTHGHSHEQLPVRKATVHFDPKPQVASHRCLQLGFVQLSDTIAQSSWIGPGSEHMVSHGVRFFCMPQRTKKREYRSNSHSMSHGTVFWKAHLFRQICGPPAYRHTCLGGYHELWLQKQLE